MDYTCYIYEPTYNKFKPQYYYAHMIQSSARSSPNLFNDFAHDAKLIMEYIGVTYLDQFPRDFIIMAHPPGSNLDVMLSTCGDLGFAVNHKKVVHKPPTNNLELMVREYHPLDTIGYHP